MFDDPMYREEILDHARSTDFRGQLDPADHQAELDNPLCGDHLQITLRIDDQGRIDAIRYDGHGCAISLAAASMLAEHVEGRSLVEVREMSSEAMIELLGIPLTPLRIKCALLAWRTLQHAIPAQINAYAHPHNGVKA